MRKKPCPKIERRTTAFAKARFHPFRPPRHKQAGIPIAEWRDGRAVLVPPEKIDTRAVERAIAAMRRPRRRGRRSADGSVRNDK